MLAKANKNSKLCVAGRKDQTQRTWLIRKRQEASKRKQMNACPELPKQ